MITPVNPFFLLNQKRNNKVTKPKIETLNNYTKLSPNEFIKLVAKRTEVSGLTESIGYINSWYGFDDLKHEEKIDFVRRIETPEYYSLVSRVKRIIKKVRNGRGSKS
jgi:hypothetical protein